MAFLCSLAIVVLLAQISLALGDSLAEAKNAAARALVFGWLYRDCKTFLRRR